MAGPALADAAVVVDGADTIIAVGPRAEIKPAFVSLPEERARGALLPGLVNAHTHVELSVLAGRLRGGEGLVPWAMQVGRETAAFSTTPPGARPWLRLRRGLRPWETWAIPFLPCRCWPARV
jgi:cytosine/adenosine deaminase-related metal-dependent hydrolase